MENSVKMNEKCSFAANLSKTFLFLVFLVFSLNLSAQTESTCSAATGLVVKSVWTNSVKIGYVLPAGISKAYLEVVKNTAPVTDATVWTSKEILISSTYSELGELVPGTKYVYRIKTICTNGTVKYTTPGDFITTATNTETCVAATGQSVLGKTTNAVKIGYTLPAGISKAYLEVVAYTAPVTDATVWTSKEILIPSTYTERGDLVAGTKYVYRIKTICTNGTVKYTTPGDFITTSATTSTCAAATNVSVSNITATSVKVNFKLPADVATASLELFPPNATTAISKPINPLTATSIERFELTPSTRYTFKIKTTCTNNVVNYSAIADFTTVAAAQPTTETCSAATGLVVKSVGTNGVKIGYTLPTGIGSATLLVVAATPTPTDATVWLTKDIALGSTYTERGDLLPSTKYIFKVKTGCTNGTLKYSSLGDFTTSATTSAMPPCSPATNLTVSNITANTATFNYTLPLGIASATLEVIPANSIAWLTRNLSTTSTSYVRNELMIATKYYYRIRTVCSNGTVSYTPEANFSTSGNKNGELTTNDFSTQSLNDLTVNCFPNPATSGITVNILGGEGQMVDLQLANMYGTVVFQSKFAQNEIQNIDVGSYPRGIYVLRVSVSGKTNSLKIVLN